MKEDVLGMLDFVIGVAILASIPVCLVIDKVFLNEYKKRSITRRESRINRPLEVFPHPHPEKDSL